MPHLFLISLYQLAYELWKEVALQELFSCYISSNSYILGQTFLWHRIYALSASAADCFLWMALHRICAENSDAFHISHPWATACHRYSEQATTPKNQTTARSAVCLQSRKISLLSTSSSLHSVLYIDYNELLETHAGGMVEQSCT